MYLNVRMIGVNRNVTKKKKKSENEVLNNYYCWQCFRELIDRRCHLKMTIAKRTSSISHCDFGTNSILYSLPLYWLDYFHLLFNKINYVTLDVHDDATQQFHSLINIHQIVLGSYLQLSELLIKKVLWDVKQLPFWIFNHLINQQQKKNKL